MKIITAIIFLMFSFSAYAEEIKYEIYRIDTGKLIGSGIKEYTKNDVIISPHKRGGGEVVDKLIELEQGYKVGARITKMPTVIGMVGFGLVTRLTENDFSWEWYNHDKDDLFRKLHGNTLVRVKTSRSSSFVLLEEVQFLDDTKLSFCLGGAGNPESHDIIIKKGSILKFN